MKFNQTFSSGALEDNVGSNIEQVVLVFHSPTPTRGVQQSFYYCVSFTDCERVIYVTVGISRSILQYYLISIQSTFRASNLIYL